MKIGQYCQRQRCRHVELEQFGRLTRRAGLSAIAGLSCLKTVSNNKTVVLARYQPNPNHMFEHRSTAAVLIETEQL